MGIAAVTLAMRAVAFFHYRFDSDEPQHLHVAWGWTAGLLQYRDVFDNHAPLFHMAMAPLLRARSASGRTSCFYMRAPMLMLWIIVSVADVRHRAAAVRRARRGRGRRCCSTSCRRSF